MFSPWGTSVPTGAGTPKGCSHCSVTEKETHLGVLQQKPRTLNEIPVPESHKQQGQHSPQSKSDRQERWAGRGAELLNTQEFRAGFAFQTLGFSPARCLPAGTQHHPANSTELPTNGGSDQHQQLPLMFDNMVRYSKSNF